MRHRARCHVLIGAALLGLFLAACEDEPKRRRTSDDDGPERPSTLSSADRERAALHRHLEAEARALQVDGSARPLTAGSASTRSLRGSRSDVEAGGDPGDPDARWRKELSEIGLLGEGAGGDPDNPGARWSPHPRASAPGAFGGGAGVRGGKPPSVRMGATSVSGRLPPEVIQRIVRQNFGRFRLCYENGLRNNPNLQGRVAIRFVIGVDGSVGSVSGGGDLPDSAVIGCVTKAFYGLTFPKPEGGIVTVSYPIAFSPGGDTPSKSAPTLQGTALGAVTFDDLKKALEKAGCTEIEKRVVPNASKGYTLLAATQDVSLVVITWVQGEKLPRAEVQSLEKYGVVFEEGTFLLSIAIAGDSDKSAARKLLDQLIVK